MTTVAYLYAPHLAADLAQLLVPSLKGRPLVVTSEPQRGTVDDCSWEAAALGVRPGMPLRQARLACPDLVVQPHRPDHVQQRLELVWEALVQAGAVVEPDPPNGAFVAPPEAADPSALVPPVQAALPAVWVLGAGPTRLVAKAAALEQAERLHRRLTASGRPEGLPAEGRVLVRFVSPDEAPSFLKGLPLRHFWVCPDPVRDQLMLLGFKTVGAVSSLEAEALVERFGAVGWQIWQKSQGIDSDLVLAAYPPPSAARGMDLDDAGISWVEQGAFLADQVRRWARSLHAHLLARMQTALALGMRLWLHPPGVTLTEGVRLGDERRGPRTWEDLALRLLHRIGRQAGPWLAGGACPRRLELIASPLRPARPHQASWDPRPVVSSRRSRLHEAIRAVWQQVGPGTIYPASEKPLSRREAMLALVEQGAGLP